MYRQLLPLIAPIFLCTSVLAEEPRTSPAIVVGQPVADSIAILKGRELSEGTGVFEEGGGSKDSDSFLVDLDDDTLVRVFFSKSKQRVTGLVLMIGKGQPKGYRKWLSAKALWLVDDGSYIAHLLPRVIDRSPPKNEYPTAKDVPTPRPSSR